MAEGVSEVVPIIGNNDLVLTRLLTAESTLTSQAIILKSMISTLRSDHHSLDFTTISGTCDDVLNELSLIKTHLTESKQSHDPPTSSEHDQDYIRSAAQEKRPAVNDVPKPASASITKQQSLESTTTRQPAMGWECSACTLINNVKLRACNVCGTKKPSDPKLVALVKEGVAANREKKVKNETTGSASSGNTSKNIEQQPQPTDTASVDTSEAVPPSSSKKRKLALVPTSESAKKAIAATSGGALLFSGQSKKAKKPNHEGSSSSGALWSDGDDGGNTAHTDKTSVVVCTEPWTCGRCTFENKAKVKNCDVCGNPQKEKVKRPAPPPFTFRRDPRIGMDYQMDPEQLPTAQILSKQGGGISGDADDELGLRRDDMNCDNELWEVLWLCGEDGETIDECTAVGNDEKAVMGQGVGWETIPEQRHEHDTNINEDHPMDTVPTTSSDHVSGNTMLIDTISHMEFKIEEVEVKRDSAITPTEGGTSSPVGSTDIDVVSTSTSSFDDAIADEQLSSTHQISIHSQSAAVTAAAVAAALPPTLSTSAVTLSAGISAHTALSSSSSSASSANGIDKHEKTLQNQNRSPVASYLSGFPGHEVQALQVLLHCHRDVIAATAHMQNLCAQGGLRSADRWHTTRLELDPREVFFRALRSHGENWMAVRTALQEHGYGDFSVAQLQDCYYGQLCAEHKKECERALRQYEHKVRLQTIKANKEAKRKAAADKAAATSSSSSSSSSHNHSDNHGGQMAESDMEIDTNQPHRCVVDGDQVDNDQIAYRDDGTGTGTMVEDPKGSPRNHSSPVRAVAVRSGQGTCMSMGLGCSTIDDQRDKNDDDDDDDNITAHDHDRHQSAPSLWMQSSNSQAEDDDDDDDEEEEEETDEGGSMDEQGLGRLESIGAKLAPEITFHGGDAGESGIHVMDVMMVEQSGDNQPQQ